VNPGCTSSSSEHKAPIVVPTEEGNSVNEECAYCNEISVLICQEKNGSAVCEVLLLGA
jgi:hypothetical protein